MLLTVTCQIEHFHSYLLTTSVYIFVLSSVYLVEYTLHQNLMIEIHTRNFDLHITVPSPNLAFLCRNLDYKPYSINLIHNKEMIGFSNVQELMSFSKIYVFRKRHLRENRKECSDSNIIFR